MQALKDDDPIWEQHSGGSGHSGVEWDLDDLPLAKDLYAALPDYTRFVFDLMIDRPGERINADFIAEQLSNWPGWTEDHPANRHIVAYHLRPFAGPHKSSGRRLPFYWWKVNRGPSLYAIKPTVARIFGDARRTVVANGLETSP